MSVTIFVQERTSCVCIVRWFRDPVVRIDYATGPLIEFSLESFRKEGFAWLKRHFTDYSTIRLAEDQVVQVFQNRDATKVMKQTWILEISSDPLGRWTISPMLPKRYSLADLEVLDSEKCKSLPIEVTIDIFWQAFDRVLEALRAESLSD